MIKMPDEENVDNSNSVLVSQSSNFPEGITEWVLEESGDVLECSPFLSHISWLLGPSDELSEITIGLLGEGSIVNNKVKELQNR